MRRGPAAVSVVSFGLPVRPPFCIAASAPYRLADTARSCCRRAHRVVHACGLQCRRLAQRTCGCQPRANSSEPCMNVRVVRSAEWRGKKPIPKHLKRRHEGAGSNRLASTARLACGQRVAAVSGTALPRTAQDQRRRSASSPGAWPAPSKAVRRVPSVRVAASATSAPPRRGSRCCC